MDTHYRLLMVIFRESVAPLGLDTQAEHSTRKRSALVGFFYSQ